jgi:hypothetical protein
LPPPLKKKPYKAKEKTPDIYNESPRREKRISKNLIVQTPPV